MPLGAHLILLNQIGYLISYCTALGANTLIKDAALKKEIIDQADSAVKLCLRTLLVGGYSDWLRNDNLGASIAIKQFLSQGLKANPDQDHFDMKLNENQIDVLRANSVRLCHAGYWKKDKFLIRYFSDLRVAQIYWDFPQELIHELAKAHKPIEECGLSEANISLEW